MPIILKSLFLLVTVVLASCTSITVEDDSRNYPPLSKIVGADQDNYFIDETGKRFFPWGLNYTSTREIGFIDDQLHSDHAWQTIEEDFAEMRQHYANTVRVHLQYNRFMLDPVTPDMAAFTTLQRLVDIAEKQQLYLIITGLGTYRKEETPPWYDRLSTAERWKSQALFWQTLADTVGHSNAVFAYDLMNEPVVSVCGADEAACDWHVGKSLGGSYFVQNISVEPNMPYRETMRAWINTLTTAIRSRDTRTLITVGNMGRIWLDYFEDDLDFVSTHLYPQRGKLDSKVDFVRFAELSRPLVIEEIFNLHCSAEELGEFLDAIDGHYQGLMGHYFGRTLEELASCTSLQDQVVHNFLILFEQRSPNRGEAKQARP